MTYHPFNSYIKRYLLQNFPNLSTDQQIQDIFPQPPIVAYNRDLNLRDILVHSTDSSSTQQPGSHARQCPRCPTPLTNIRGPKTPSPCAIILPVLRKILCTVSPAGDAPISTLAKLGKVSGVVACVAGVIKEREGERGRREKMKGIGKRGEGRGNACHKNPIRFIPAQRFSVNQITLFINNCHFIHQSKSGASFSA